MFHSVVQVFSVFHLFCFSSLGLSQICYHLGNFDVFTVLLSNWILQCQLQICCLSTVSYIKVWRVLCFMLWFRSFLLSISVYFLVSNVLRFEFNAHQDSTVSSFVTNSILGYCLTQAFKQMMSRICPKVRGMAGISFVPQPGLSMALAQMLAWT